MSTNRDVNEVLALLETLKSVVGEFAAREEKLTSEFRNRSAAQLRMLDSTTRDVEAKRTEEMEVAETFWATAAQACNSRYERRKAALSRAHAATRKALQEKLDSEERQSVERVREGTAAAEQRRNAALEASAVNFATLQQTLTNGDGLFARQNIAVRKAFGGYGAFRNQLAPTAGPTNALPQDDNEFVVELHRVESRLDAELRDFQKFPAPKFFRFLPLWLAILLFLAGAAAAPVLQHFGNQTVPMWMSGVFGAVLVLIVILYFVGKRTAEPTAKAIAQTLARNEHLLVSGRELIAAHHEQTQEQLTAEFENTVRGLNQEWKQRTKELASERGTQPSRVDDRLRHANQQNEAFHDKRAVEIRSQRAQALAAILEDFNDRLQKLSSGHAEKSAAAQNEYDTQWSALEQEWISRIESLWTEIRVAGESIEKMFPDWSDPIWNSWKPPTVFRNCAKFGSLNVDLPKFAGPLPKDSRLAPPCPLNFSVPLALTYPRAGSILFETGKTGGAESAAAMNDIIFRLIATTPPGKLSFTIFDPVGLGENFAALMHLADYEEGSINSRIWTQQAQFEEKLAELNEHMEKVIQMYLRNEYETIAEYNAEAGTIAEKYHFLVIASFPVNFSDTAARRLRNIAASGARCGVYTLIQWDQRHALPQDFVPDELRANSVCITHGERGFEFANRKMPGTQLLLDAPPSPEFATNFLHEAGKSSKNTNRVEVPFQQVAPGDGELWSEETSEELRVPIGRSGATKLQYLEIGKGTRQHALIAGKTGSGKSTLFHIIITNLALWCSPEQVEFYLVDFKKGVEFKCYANRKLPHAKVVAIESDRAFGLSVLQRVDEELRRRGDLFRKLGAQDLAGYKRAGGKEPMPRSLLMIDEFQEFFVEEDRVSQGAAVLLDRIIRQGRAFGIHVLLGSQTLGGAYTLARATIGQMVIRIALQCNEADAYLIMDQDNPAPRLLSRPGEGIYNDSAGSIEGNSPFQAVWLADTVRDSYLEKVRALADRDEKRFPGPFVFEGNAPADVNENLTLKQALESHPSNPPPQSRVWLGSPNSIKGPTEGVFQKQSGSNLLIVGQSEERTLTLLAVAMVSLSAQYPPGKVRFIVADSTPPGFAQREFLQRVIESLPHETIQINNSNLSEVMGGLAEELKNRSGNEHADAPETFVLIQGLQNFKKLRQEDEFSLSSSETDGGANPAAVLLDLITEGPARGFHVIASCDTYNNVTRFLGRKTLGEFEMRVLFQMSASDSASLIDAPDAATLGFHRALLYNDREGYIQTFRPYAHPGNDWLEETAQGLKR